MLGFFSNKSNHPLTSLKSTQQLLDGLPKADAVEVLQEIAHWIEALFDSDNAFRLDHQFAVLRMLDEVAHPHLRKVIHSYFAATPPAAFQENRLWNSMNDYFTFSELGYLHLLRGVRNSGKGSNGIKSNASLIVARGVYAVSGRMECAAVRYELIDPQLWMNMAEFYDYAEVEQSLDLQLAVYAGLGANTSVRHLFASMLIWCIAGMGSFKPLDMHIAKRLITHLGKFFTITEECQGKSVV